MLAQIAESFLVLALGGETTKERGIQNGACATLTAYRIARLGDKISCHLPFSILRIELTKFGWSWLENGGISVALYECQLVKEGAHPVTEAWSP